jgi:hypothetical protein
MRVLCLCVSIICTANALDTTEPYDRGFSDFELTGSYSGIGNSRSSRTLGWEGLIGVGITERFSASVIYAMESDDYFAPRDDELVLELFFTPVDLKTFDLDLFGGTGTNGGLGLGIECNLDFPQFGIQLVVEESLDNKGNPDDERLFTTGIAPLVYYNISKAAQLLAGIDFSIPHGSSNNDSSLDIGNAVIGYNIILSDAVELLAEAGVDIPQEDENLSFGFAIQLISTLPAGENR